MGWTRRQLLESAAAGLAAAAAGAGGEGRTGNDARRESGILPRAVRASAEVFRELADVRERFARDYAAMLDVVLARGKPTAVCTVYDPNYPDRLQQRLAAAGLTAFNDGITRE